MVDKPSSVSIKLWSINSPTIDDSSMECIISLGGRPILLFDPIFINNLAKFFKNI